MEGTDQIKALEEHFHCAVIDSGLVLIQTSPIELWVKTAAIDSGLIIRELTGLPEPAVGIAIKPTPIQKGVEINGATTELNAVLLQPPLQLQILLLSRRHEAKAGGPRYR